MTENYTRRSFVAPDPNPVETPRADIIRRSDVVHVIDTMLDTYQQQQRAALEAVQHDAQRGGYLSDAAQVAERRKTSRMYLLTYAAVSAMTTGGLCWIAYLAGIDGALALGGWVFATGGLTLFLSHRSHAKEFDHSPEGIARHVIDAHWDVASYEAETRRKAIKWEHLAEQRRQEAQAQAAADARQLAALRIEEMETRRRASEAANEQQVRIAWQPKSTPTDQEGLHGAQPPSPSVKATERTDAPCNPVTAGASWQVALTQWLAGLYQTDATTEQGIIRQRVPWSQRSSWTERDKREAKRVCCDMRPQLIVQVDGGRWRLRREMFTDVDQALQVLSQRLVGD